jgi:hypothetical protein
MSLIFIKLHLVFSDLLQVSMAFFGLTALGSNSSLRSAQLATLGATLFTDSEFSLAFNSVAGAGELAVTRLTEVLDLTYGFEPLPEEVALFRSSLAPSQETLRVYEFLEAVQKVRAVAASLAENGKSYRSFQDLADDRRKHRRAKHGPMEVFKMPQTANQGFGWHLEKVNLVRYPKNACPETKYADALVKSGWM